VVSVLDALPPDKVMFYATTIADTFYE